MRSADSRWALWDRKYIPPPDDPNGTYLARLRIVSTPWFGIYIHRIEMPDDDRGPHDHPWTFWSAVLRGGYTESILDTPSDIKRWCVRRRRIGSVHRMPLGRFHQITALDRTPTWTLIACGPKSRRWGFLRPNGVWVDNAVYERAGTPSRSR
jgi:hypothetical protein